VHDVTLSVAAMRVSNPDRAPALIYRRNTTPTPTGFAEILCDHSQYVAPAVDCAAHFAWARFSTTVERFPGG
jgi:hypothetical protein